MLLDSSGPSTPEDSYAVALRIGLPGKRKLLDMDVHDTLSHKVLSINLQFFGRLIGGSFACIYSTI